MNDDAVSGRAQKLIDESLADREGVELAERVRLSLRLGQLVYRMRTHAGFTQAELARRIGARQSMISRLEGGNLGHVPGNELLDGIAAACGYRMTITMEPEPGHDRLEPIEVILHG